MKAEWTEKDVLEFVEENLNYYFMDLSEDETRDVVSPWKKWLWLEKNGFDFIHTSLESEIVKFRHNSDLPFYLKQSDRQLLIQIRNKMRDILCLPLLTTQECERILSADTISNFSHWSAVYNKAVPDTQLSDRARGYVDDVWRFLAVDRPDYVQLIRSISRHDSLMTEPFVDMYTKNGAYELKLDKNERRSMIYFVSKYYIVRIFDLAFPLGNISLLNKFSGAFLDSLDKFIGGN